MNTFYKRLLTVCLCGWMLCLPAAVPAGASKSNGETGNDGVRLNQVGYYPDASKIAVIDSNNSKIRFYVINADTEQVVFGAMAQRMGKTSRADFSTVTETGNYYILTSEGMQSPVFRIAPDVYQELTDALVKFFYYQRCGCELTDAGLLSHKACHDWEANVYDADEKKVGTMDAIGGWHDAGDYGRYILPQAAAVYELMSAYAKNPEIFGDSSGIPESGNGIADILDECRWELEWMLKMQESETGGVHPQVHSKHFIETMMPDQDPYELAVTPVTTESTAKFAAVMAYASRIYRTVDSTFADRCLQAAEAAWGFLEAHPEGVLDLVSFTQYSHTGTMESIDLDDVYWAAAELFRTTGEQKYLNRFAELQEQIGTQCDFGWGAAGGFGTVSFLETESDLIDPALRSKVLQDYVNAALEGPYGKATSINNPYFNADTNWWWGSNMCIGNAAFWMYSAGQLGGHEELYLAGSRQIDYLLGENMHSVCFVTDFGTNFPQTPLHGPSKASGGRIPGALVGGAYQTEDYYVDDPENYYCNEVSCYYNSALVVTLAYASVCRNSEEEILPENQVVVDVSGLTLARLWEMIRNQNFEGESTGESQESGEPEAPSGGVDDTEKGCKSSAGGKELAVLTGLSLPLLPFAKGGRASKKRKKG